MSRAKPIYYINVEVREEIEHPKKLNRSWDFASGQAGRQTRRQTER